MRGFFFNLKFFDVDPAAIAKLAVVDKNILANGAPKKGITGPAFPLGAGLVALFTASGTAGLVAMYRCATGEGGGQYQGGQKRQQSWSHRL